MTKKHKLKRKDQKTDSLAKQLKESAQCKGPRKSKYATQQHHLKKKMRENLECYLWFCLPDSYGSMKID